MNETQIKKLLTTNVFTRKYFNNVCSLDEIKYQQPSGLIVINLDKRSKPGSHWCLIFFNYKGKPSFFDPLGHPPYLKEIIDFLKSHGPLEYNNCVLQHPSAVTCGPWICVLSVLFCLGHNIEEICNLFSKTDTLKNELKLESMFKKYF